MSMWDIVVVATVAAARVVVVAHNMALGCCRE